MQQTIPLFFGSIIKLKVLSTKVKQSNISCTIVPVAIKDLVYNIPNGKTHLQDTCIFKQL